MTESKKKRMREIQEQRLKMFEGDFYQEKKVGKEVIERARKFSRLDKIRYKINLENMESVEKLLKD